MWSSHSLAWKYTSISNNRDVSKQSYPSPGPPNASFVPRTPPFHALDIEQDWIWFVVCGLCFACTCPMRHMHPEVGEQQGLGRGCKPRTRFFWCLLALNACLSAWVYRIADQPATNSAALNSGRIVWLLYVGFSARHGFLQFNVETLYSLRIARGCTVPSSQSSPPVCRWLQRPSEDGYHQPYERQATLSLYVLPRLQAHTILVSSRRCQVYCAECSIVA